MNDPIVSSQIRLRYPHFFKIGKNSIVDDFCYFSTRIEIGEGSHIASGCSIAGGRQHSFKLGNYSSLSSGVKIFCASNDFVEGLIAIFPPGEEERTSALVTGDVVLADYTGVGANSVIMPNNNIPEGTAIGALSFVPANYLFDPWSVYAGVPVRKVKPRNRDNVLKQLERIRLNQNEPHDL